VTLLPGDGIGPEITAATKVALEALCKKAGFSIELKEALIGGAAIDAAGDPFPAESLAQCQASDSVLLACIGGYKWDNNPRELRPETGLLKMRKQMGLFANLRPAKVLPQLLDASTLKREVVEDVDVMVVRELTGDVYFGTPKGIDVVDGTCTVAANRRNSSLDNDLPVFAYLVHLFNGSKRSFIVAFLNQANVLVTTI
jgi:3-isopropylmalate dehydrogenase